MDTYKRQKEVIIIEAEPYYRVSMTYLLSRLGYVVTACSGCDQGGEMVRERARRGRPFGLIIVELNQASLALARALAAAAAEIPMLFTTGSPDHEQLRTCRSLDMTAVLLKPYSFDEMVRTMAGLQAVPGRRETAGTFAQERHHD